MSLVALIIIASSTLCEAQDKCSDVLKNGTFQTASYRSREYVSQIILARFASASFEEAKNDKTLGFGVPVGEVVFNGDFTESQFKRKQEELRRTFSYSAIRNHELDVALASGDSTIVKAWRDCMVDRTGLSIRFIPYNSTQIVLSVEFFAPAGVAQTKLTDGFELNPGGRNDSKGTIGNPDRIFVQAGSKCIEKGTVIKDKIPCTIVLQLPNAERTLTVALISTHGSATAYLAPRLKRVTERKPFEFTAQQLNTLRHASQGGGDVPSKVPRLDVVVSSADRAQGWRFDPRSADAGIIFNVAVDDGRCSDKVAEADEYSAKFQYTFVNNNRSRTLDCSLMPRVDLIKESWQPIDFQLKTSVITKDKFGR